jgi:hypothetical protein
MLGPGNIEERRQSVRYEVTLSVVASHGLMSSTLPATSHDISSKGAGLIFDTQLSPGETVEVTFIMPDDGEKIHVRGTVKWVASLGPNRFRAGLAFADSDQLRPIPIVMRSLKVRTRRYNG